MSVDDLTWTRIDIPGTNNVRDLGGYPTEDGRTVRRGRFLRSEALAHPGASEVHAIWDAAHEADYRRLGLATVVDLRTDRETTLAPSAWHAATGAEVVSLPIVEGGEGSGTYVMGELLDGTRTRVAAEDMAELYAGTYDRRADVLGTIVRMLAEPDRGPLLVHCSAGKDRTGVVVALVLSALGVPRDLVVRDYALTGVFRPDRVQHYAEVFAGVGLDLDDVRVLFETPAEAMAGALDHLDTAYGGAVAYLRDRAGITDDELASLRANLLDER